MANEKNRPELEITRLSDVEPQEVEWLWPRRIPRGKVTLLAGDPGLGKSYMSLDIASRISRGLPWPDDAGSAPQGNVLVLSAEDDLADTVRPRLDLLGADTKRIRSIGLGVQRGEKREFFTLTNHLDQVVDELERRETSLLVVDPITAFTGSVDTHKSAEVRSLMLRLAELADTTGCAILGVIHLNKKRGEYNALYRVMASLDFVAAARSVMVVGPHPDDPTVRVLATAKCNLSAHPDSLSYSITDDGFAWGEAVVLAADDMFIRTPGRAKQPVVDRGKEFLSALLANGAARQTSLTEDAKSAGIGESSLKKAKAALGIKSAKRPDGWYWSLPAPTTEQEEGVTQ